MASHPSPSVRFCPGCGSQQAEPAQFCWHCGEPIPPPPAAPGTPAEGGAFHPAESPPEDAPRLHAEQELFELRPLAIRSFVDLLLVVLTLGLWALPLWWRSLGTGYRITSERIEIRRGLVNVERATVELFRVEDLELRQPLFLRLRSAATVVVRSQDRHEPDLVLTAIEAGQEVHEALREAVLGQRRSHRVRLMEGFEG